MEYEFTEQISRELKLYYPRAKVGVLGGTFNPLHNGHIEMALNIKREFSLAKVIFVPCGTPPHKMNEPSLAPAVARLYMAELCVFMHNGLEVSNAEVLRDGPSYTIDTMREFNLKYKETDFYFIIGSDTLFELESWKDFASLAKLVRFVCVKRPHSGRLVMAAEVERLSGKYGCDIQNADYNGLFVSSSYIRKRVSEGKSITEFVPPAVEEFIHANGLYKQQG